MTENAEKRRRKALSTSRTIVLVFTAVIALGTLLLLLPVSSRDGCCCGFKTALFTATSSTCVTGLVLCDTWSQWSGFGQFVILALIEIGGLGFMSLASVVIFMTRRKISFQQRILIAESISTEYTQSIDIADTYEESSSSKLNKIVFIVPGAAAAVAVPVLIIVKKKK